MTFATTRSVALLGVRGIVIEVEAHLGRGLSRFGVIGLPDTVLSESRDRVRAAVINSGEDWPDGKITVSLSPAWIRKQGSVCLLRVPYVA